MEYFNKNSLKALAASIEKKDSDNMQAVERTFNEVYENLEGLDKRIEALGFSLTAAYLGCSFCGTAYIGVSETDTKGV